MAIKVVLFDWSGTLGRQKTRYNFIYKHNDNPKKKLKYFYSDTLPILKFLHKRGIPMGIVSNTNHDPLELQHALMSCGLHKFFSLNIFTDGNILCKKPCTCLFNHISAHFKNIKPKEILFVGNNYNCDIGFAHACGMSSAYIQRQKIDKTKNKIIKKIAKHTYLIKSLLDLQELSYETHKS